MSKYQALANFLREHEGEEIELGFDQVSDIVGGLPPSALNERPWWANDSGPTNAHAPGWMSVGWRVRTVDLQSRRVTFIRASSDRWTERTRQPPRSPVQHAWLVR
jgi:hypothetical protein